MVRSCNIASLIPEPLPQSCQSPRCALLLCLPTFPTPSQMREEYKCLRSPEAQPPPLPPPPSTDISLLLHLHHPLPASLHPWLLSSKDSQRHSPEWDKSDFSRHMATWQHMHGRLCRPPAGVAVGATLILRLRMHMFDLLSQHQWCVTLENHLSLSFFICDSSVWGTQRFKAWDACHVTATLTSDPGSDGKALQHGWWMNATYYCNVCKDTGWCMLCRLFFCFSPHNINV